ncbi:hypothetical protein BDN71DRAFT_1515911 [Pleurotus eryngii]|uniref:Uncharacterized protein n=1 Tax=Pleurotus eryngii TaxID=5323 RepID=A0A9P6DKE2_PLEER|nr:hypothetical protein BDN71DRAFT_1515911 [Pleurotus eryngii]
MDNPADGPGSVPQVEELEGRAEVGPTSMREEPAKVPEVSANAPEVSTNAPEKSMNAPEDSATTLKDLDKRFGRGWAKGARLIFLQSHLERYKTACNESRSKGHDVMDSIHNAYFKQFDWRQPVTEEPEEGAPPPNPLKPLSPEERKLKGAVVDRLKQSIASWLNYRTNRVDTGLSHLTNKSTNDPFAILLSKLSGVGLKPPKRRAAWEHYAKEASDELKANFEQEFQQSGKPWLPGTQHANARNKFMHDSFDALEPDQKECWAADAKEWHRVQVQATNARDSLIRNMTPSQRQNCLNRLGDLFYPIIDGVNELLDMHVSVLVGGPEPAKGGRLNALLDEVTTRLSAEPPSVKRPVDDSWPLWFKNQYKVLYEVKSMPDMWFVLLTKFDLFKEMTAYNNTGNGLATLNRPEEISWWIRAGQKANPTLSDVDKFGDNWWRWWISLQPEWRGVASEESALERRHRQADKAVSCAAAAWEELDKPGRNGFLSPIAALFWWASARIDSLKKLVVTEESSEDQALESELTEEHENLPECEDWTLEFEDGHDWLMAVADMTWVMDCMMISRKATM